MLDRSWDELRPRCLPIEDLAYVKQMVVLDEIGVIFELLISQYVKTTFHFVLALSVALAADKNAGLIDAC